MGAKRFVTYEGLRGWFLARYMVTLCVQVEFCQSNYKTGFFFWKDRLTKNNMDETQNTEATQEETTTDAQPATDAQPTTEGEAAA